MAMTSPSDFSLALTIVGDVMVRGAASHPGDDWRAYPPAFHVAKAERHVRLYREGDKSEPHLAHAATRLLMALELSCERP